jgi:hypothetical protein
MDRPARQDQSARSPSVAPFELILRESLSFSARRSNGHDRLSRGLFLRDRALRRQFVAADGPGLPSHPRASLSCVPADVAALFRGQLDEEQGSPARVLTAEWAAPEECDGSLMGSSRQSLQSLQPGAKVRALAADWLKSDIEGRNIAEKRFLIFRDQFDDALCRMGSW